MRLNFLNILYEILHSTMTDAISYASLRTVSFFKSFLLVIIIYRSVAGWGVGRGRDLKVRGKKTPKVSGRREVLRWP